MKADLGSLPPQIDVLSLIEQASPCCRSIYAEIPRVRLENMSNAVGKIRELVGICEGKEGHPHLLDFGPDTKPNHTIGIRPVPVAIIEWLDDPDKPQEYIERLVERRIDVSEMLSPNDLHQSMQESLRVGAGVLSAFYDAHGSGRAFAYRVNKIADDVGDLFPVIVGITETAAVAISMAAAALGTDARDLLGGMVNRSTPSN